MGRTLSMCRTSKLKWPSGGSFTGAPPLLKRLACLHTPVGLQRATLNLNLPCPPEVFIHHRIVAASSPRVAHRWTLFFPGTGSRSHHRVPSASTLTWGRRGGRRPFSPSTARWPPRGLWCLKKRGKRSGPMRAASALSSAQQLYFGVRLCTAGTRHGPC